MKLELNKVLECVGEAEVVTANVDLTQESYRGIFPFKEPIVLEARASNRAGVVTLNCTYTYTLHLTCDRCLTTITREVTQEASHIVVRELNNTEDDDFLLAPSGIVELSELAQGDIVLELPGKFLCKEDCKGLCPKCGQNLNHGSCGCDTRQLDPRFAALDRFYEE
ncbi:MAG: DUF177 domain-containing protein [Angelakisella sp.]